MVSRDVKVGLFVAISLVILATVVFFIGEERKLFSDHLELRAAFEDVKGLTKGSPVRMGGVDIGSVFAGSPHLVSMHARLPSDATVHSSEPELGFAEPGSAVRPCNHRHERLWPCRGYDARRDLDACTNGRAR